MHTRPSLRVSAGRAPLTRPVLRPVLVTGVTERGREAWEGRPKADPFLLFSTAGHKAPGSCLLGAPPRYHVLPEAATRPVLPGTPCPFPQVSVLPDPGAAAQRCFKAGGKRGVCDTVFYRRKLTETCSQRLTKGPAASGSASSPGLRASDLLLVLVNSICFALARHQNNLPT